MAKQWQDRLVDVIGGAIRKIEMLKAAGFEPKTIIMNSADIAFVENLCAGQYLLSPISPMKLFGLTVVVSEVDEVQVGV